MSLHAPAAVGSGILRRERRRSLFSFLPVPGRDAPGSAFRGAQLGSGYSSSPPRTGGLTRSSGGGRRSHATTRRSAHRDRVRVLRAHRVAPPRARGAIQPARRRHLLSLAAPPRDPASKVHDWSGAARWRASQHGRVVFTNGVFDLLHPGHVDVLLGARRTGDALIVAVNSDDSVRRLKGPSRPVRGEAERAYV